MEERTKEMVMAERMVLLLINQKVSCRRQRRNALPKVSRFSRSVFENEISQYYIMTCTNNIITQTKPSVC